MRLLLLLVLPIVCFSQTQYSEIVKGSTTETDTLLALLGTGADTSRAYALCKNTTFRVDVTTSNDSTQLDCYPIFTDTPYRGYSRPTQPRGIDGLNSWTNTWGLVDSTDFVDVDDNGVQFGQPILLDSPALFVCFVCKGKSDNEKVDSTKVKVTLTQDCEE